MSNSIWKTPDQKPDNDNDIVCLVGVLPFAGYYEKFNASYVEHTTGENYTPDEIDRWCYIDDLIAQANKAERLEKENEAMREEFEVWHGNHKCVLEDLEIARKALEYYADSRFGKKQDDGTYALEIDKGCGVTVVYIYDPRPAKKALEQIERKE